MISPFRCQVTKDERYHQRSCLSFQNIWPRWIRQRKTLRQETRTVLYYVVFCKQLGSWLFLVRPMPASAKLLNPMVTNGCATPHRLADMEDCLIYSIHWIERTVRIGDGPTKSTAQSWDSYLWSDWLCSTNVERRTDSTIPIITRGASNQAMECSSQSATKPPVFTFWAFRRAWSF